MDRKRISIYEIANEAGVSPATVSRVINESARVSDDKKEKVWKIIRKYDFKPNALAKGLSSSRSGILGILVAHVDSPFYAKLVAECERVTNEMGYTLLMSSSLSDHELERKQLQKMYEQCVDAIILLGGNMDADVVEEKSVSMVNYLAETVPIVVTGKSHGIPCYEVRLDESGGMELAMEYLIGLGHREIAFPGGMANVYSTLEKRLAYQRILRKYGMEFREEWIKDGDYNQEAGYRIMKKLLHGKRPGAVIGINDYFAAGALNAILDSGLRVPEDISLLAFDHTHISQILRPALTGVACDYREYARRLVVTAIDAAEGKTTAASQTVKMKLINGKSCRKAAG